MYPLALLVIDHNLNLLAPHRVRTHEIAKQLKSVGYDVEILDLPKQSELANFTAQLHYCTPVHVLHYAGPPPTDTLPDPSHDKNADDFRNALETVVRKCPSLQLLFLDAIVRPDDITSLLALRTRQDTKLTIVAKTGSPPTSDADSFPTAFYELLADPANTVETAHAQALEQTRASSVTRPTNRNEHDCDTAVVAAEESTPANEFFIHGADGFRLEAAFIPSLRLIAPHTRKSRVAVVWCLTYFAILLAIASVSSWLAHGYKSSPAFQTAFSHFLSPQHAKQLLTESSYDGDCSGCQASLRLPLNASAFSHNDPILSAGIETFRAMLYLLVLCFCSVCYNYRLPAEPHLHSREWWLSWSPLPGWSQNRPPMLALLAPLVAAIGLGVVFYHHSYAPLQLAHSDSVWHTHTKVVHADPAAPAEMCDRHLWRVNAVWRLAGNGWPDCAERWCQVEKKLGSVGGPEELNKDELALWHRMYVTPYYNYLPYSLVLWVGIAIPAVLISWSGAVASWQRINLACLAVAAEARQAVPLGKGAKHKEGKLVEVLIDAFNDVRREIARYLMFALLVVFATAFDYVIGHYTLAFLAKLMVVVAAAVLVLVAILIYVAYDRYSDAFLSVCAAGGVDRTRISHLDPSVLWQERQYRALFAAIVAVIAVSFKYDKAIAEAIIAHLR